VTILYANEYNVRHVRLNQPHLPHITPSWNGDSVGHYEGDTLVIDTVGIKVGPYAMVDMYGTPHTEALHVVERYRLLDYEVANESEDREMKIFVFRSPTPVSRATRITRAPDCCSSLQWKTRACSQSPGRPGLLIGAHWAVGRNSSAPKARATMWAERSTFRMPTNQISNRLRVEATHRSRCRLRKRTSPLRVRAPSASNMPP
jgi:hypothetical protein